MTRTTAKEALQKYEARLERFLQRPRLGLWLAAIALALASPSLFIGFHLDDHIARYIFSNLEGAKKLYEVYTGGYGLANGNPADNHWQIEQGHAPWWTYPNLRLSMFRPISLATHLLDARLWIDSAFLMHAHNLLWLALLVVVATRFYRKVMGPVVGGLAALLLAVDHTHGFIVGFICNRHALITATLGVLCLDQHHRSREREPAGRREGLSALLLYLLTLLAGESGLAIGGYLFSYAVFAERGTLKRRLLSFAPYLGVTVVWRALYNLAGYGAHGSGIYIDPVREPLHFARAFIERAPILCLGQFLLPPAEMSAGYGPRLAFSVWAFAVLFLGALGLSLLPVIRRDRMARFWAGGFLLSLVPACVTLPSGRQLLLSSVGAMALIAELWRLYPSELMGIARSSRTRLAAGVCAWVLFVHLAVAPLASPFMSCSIALARRLHLAADDVGAEIAGKDVVFVSAPEYFAVRLLQLRKRVEHKPLARRWRALSFGPVPVIVERPSERTLVLEYEGGILGTELTELFRDRRIRMTPGDRVELEGLTIEVLAVTEDGRARLVRFAFDESLDSSQFCFYYWVNNGFSRFTVPPVGARVDVPAAILMLEL